MLYSVATNSLTLLAASRKKDAAGVLEGLTNRWRRPGMRRDLLTTLYDGNAGIAGDEASPGASTRGRYAAWRIDFEFS